jgi:hypothetical protein
MRTLIRLVHLLLLTTVTIAQTVTPDSYGLKEFTINDKQLGRIQFYVDTVNISRKAPLFIEINGSGGLPLCLYVQGNRFVTTPTTFNDELFRKTKDKYHYIILGKPGTSFCDTLNLNASVEEYQKNPSQVLFAHSPSEEYTKRLSLTWRVQATRTAINYLITKGFWDKTKDTYGGIVKSFSLLVCMKGMYNANYLPFIAELKNPEQVKLIAFFETGILHASSEPDEPVVQTIMRHSKQFSK